MTTVSGSFEKLVSGKIGPQVSVESSVNELCEAVDQLLDVGKIPGQIEETKTTKSEIEHKISIFEEKGVAEKLKKQAVYTTDQTKLNSVKGTIEIVKKAIKKAYDGNNEVSSTLSDYTSDYNPVLVSEGQKILSQIDKQLIIIGDAINQIQTYETDFSEIINKLSDAITAC